MSSFPTNGHICLFPLFQTWAEVSNHPGWGIQLPQLGQVQYELPAPQHQMSDSIATHTFCLSNSHAVFVYSLPWAAAFFHSLSLWEGKGCLLQLSLLYNVISALCLSFIHTFTAPLPFCFGGFPWNFSVLFSRYFCSNLPHYRFMELRKTVILMIMPYYITIMQIKVSKTKIKGDTRHKFPVSSPCGVMRTGVWNNTYGVLLTRDVHQSLSALTILGGCHGADTSLVLVTLQALQKSKEFCMAQGPCHKSQLQHKLSDVSQVPGKQRYCYQTRYSKGLDVISQEQVKGQIFLWNTSDMLVTF